MSTVIGALRVNLGLDGSQFGQGLSRASGQAAGFQKQMVAMGAKLAGVLGAAFSARAAVQAADAWSDMSSRVGVAVKNMQAAPAIMERIHKIAQMTYSPLQQTADGFAENNATLRGLGYTTNQALDYTEALNNALVVSGAKGERAASVARALSVALATGKLSGDGLNSILSNGGEIAELLAKELGTTRNGLIEMAKQGKITGGVIVRSLIGNMDALREKAGDMPATVADGFQRIGNSLTGMVGRFDQATGTSGALAEVLVRISDTIDRVADLMVAHADAIVTALQTVAGTAAVVATVFAAQYAVAVGTTAVRAMVSAVQQSIALQMALGATSRSAAIAGAASVAFSRALMFLRTALISTGIGAIVVAAGYLAAKFVELVGKTGSLGNAMNLLGEVGREAWSRMGLYADMWLARVNALFADFRAGALELWADIADSPRVLWDAWIDGHKQTFDLMKRIWDAAPSVMGDIMWRAGESMLKALLDFVQKAMLPLNALIGAINFIRSTDFSLGDILGARMSTNENAGAAEAASARTFELDVTPKDTRGRAADLRGQAAAYREAAGILAQAASAPMSAWARMKEVMAGTKDEVVEISDVAPPAGDAIAGAGSKGKASLSDLQKVMKSLREEWERISATWNMSTLDAKIWDKQREAGVKANSVQGQQIAGIMTQIDGMEQLKDATESWSQSISSAFQKFISEGGSFKNVLSEIIGKFAEILMNNAFQKMWSGVGTGGFLGGILKTFGIGANANGTSHWRGGLSALHERGAEIVDLPNGSRVIPHELSKRMADGAGAGGGMSVVRVELGDGLRAELLQQAGMQTVQLVQANNKALPGKISQHQANPRRR